MWKLKSRIKKNTTVQRSILRNFTVLIVLILISFSTVLFFIQYSEMTVISSQEISKAANEMKMNLNIIFEPVIRNLRISKKWGENSLYSINDSKAISGIFAPILKEYPHVSAIKAVDMDGNSISLEKDGHEWITRQVQLTPNGLKTKTSAWDVNQKLIREKQEDSGDDLRKSQWYQDAIEVPTKDQIEWTDPYLTGEQTTVAIIASINVKPSQGKPFVIAFEIQLISLQDVLEKSFLSKNGMVFIVTENDKLLGLSGGILKKAGVHLNNILLKSVSSLNIEEIDSIVHSWKKRRGRPKLRQVEFFKSKGEKWVGSIKNFRLEEQTIMRVGLAAPMEDIVHKNLARLATIFFIFVLALIVAIFMTKKMSKRIIVPLRQILDQSLRISRMDLEKNDISDCHITELKQLADSHETMRKALKDSTMKLKISNEKLEEYSVSLSDKVNERTHELNLKSKELEELNRTLEQKVKTEVEANLKKDQLMLRSARQAQMGEMLSMIAHQWRQPLSSISTVTGNLLVFLELDSFNKEQFVELLSSINEHAQFLSRTINDFRNFFNPNKKKQAVMLDEILDQTINIIGRSLEYQSIKLVKN
ncbi:hypothetical protein KKA14_05500, partial [bacterium]|nr:hypothetical protein [bacterium]